MYWKPWQNFNPITRHESYGKIEGGVLIMHNRQRFIEDMRQFPDQEVVITVKKRGRRSNQQNAYYWAVIVQEIRTRFKELGHRLTADEVHSYLKEKFNPVHLCDEHGELIATFPGSTTEFNKSEMTDYIESIRQWAGEVLSLFIPDPSSSNKLEF